jgi:hypothetical protein
MYQTTIDAGWVYFVEPDLKVGSVGVKLRKICRSSDHAQAIQAFLRQNLFHPGNVGKVDYSST